MPKEADKPIKPLKIFLILVREKRQGAKRHSNEIYAVGPPRSIFTPTASEYSLPNNRGMRGLFHLRDDQIVAIDPDEPIYEILSSPFRIKPICKLGDTPAYTAAVRRVRKAESKAARERIEQAERLADATGLMAWAAGGSFDRKKKSSSPK